MDEDGQMHGQIQVMARTMEEKHGMRDISLEGFMPRSSWDADWFGDDHVWLEDGG